ncbi:MAG: transposase [Butyrivibrio sp.]|uniref:IS1634 family transposase n=1 Tax=Butyrivibrio sp. TaxID=28121 RepID=UPI001B1E0C85|nr:transposase [Butyrivibrio sp.]MBO6239552.1 transposase [Butyrivibrio sp.]
MQLASDCEQSKGYKIYISYDSTNKNSEAGDIDIVEYGKAKVDTGEPVFNYSVGYDINNREPLLYEQYPGSINDVSQLKYMVSKVKSYSYKDIGFILDRGYFSHDNLKCLDENGYDFIIMVKGIKDVVHEIIKKHKGTFESEWGSYVSEFGVYGKTVQSFIYASDSKKRYFHLFYNSGKAAGERSRFEENIQSMQEWLDRQRNQEREFNKTFHHYFYIHYDKDVFVYAEPKLDVIREELEMCGYFAIISSEEIGFKKAIELYKSRDASEKLFRADKSYLGNNTLRVASSETAANKIFVAFIALIIRSRLYTALKDKAKEMTRKPNYLTVPAAIRELEKIEMTRQIDGEYRLDRAVTKTQAEVLSAFNIEVSHVKYKVAYINDALKGA